jgi:hypothetical protein
MKYRIARQRIGLWRTVRNVCMALWGAGTLVWLWSMDWSFLADWARWR